MKSKIKIIIEVIAYLFLLTIIFLVFKACNYKGEFINLAVCGSYASPGMFCHDLKGNTYSVDVVERDAEGRVLFRYRTYNDITEGCGLAHVICQKYDSRYVYFYEDFGCYLPSSGLDFEEWKELNDWNEKLNISKMTKRTAQISLDSCVIVNNKPNRFNIEEDFAYELNSFELEKIVFCDSDENGRFLYWIKRRAKDEKAYWGIVDSEHEVYLMEISDNTINTDLLRKFKMESGWNYGGINK